MVNKAVLVGRIGKDVELRYTQTGMAVANFTLATNESFKGKDGERQERTEWHRIVAWGKQAEFCANYLGKGRQIYVEGRIQTREWDDKDTGQKRRATEIVANTIQALGSKPGAKDEAGAEQEPESGSADGRTEGERIRDEARASAAKGYRNEGGSGSSGSDDSIPF